jgi:hypothetical protein
MAYNIEFSSSIAEMKITKFDSIIINLTWKKLHNIIRKNKGRSAYEPLYLFIYSRFI